jgi:alkylation response protein AidB-like acyl-CoA dehydrogenase
VHLAPSPVEEQLRAELRAYFAQLLPESVQQDLAINGESGPLYRPLVRQLGLDGWLGLGWPVEFGGGGRSPAEQFVFFEEAVRAGAPVPLLTLNTVGPMLMEWGTQEQKQQYLPGIISGELVFAVGYSEPEAGTDLAALRTEAVRDGDEYVISGTKVYTSHAHDADYVWLACRTDPQAGRHAGISVLLVPTSAPGFSVAPIVTLGGQRTNVTYYQQVRVPVSNLVGSEGQGWTIITSQLVHERVALAGFGGLAYRLWEEVRDWAAATAEPAGGTRLELTWVRQQLAESWARLRAMQLLNLRLATDAAADRLRAADASAAKVYGSECLVDVYQRLLEILGPAGWLPPGSPGAVLLGEVERIGRATQVSTFAGGVNEIQRELVAVKGLGLPRAKR